MLASRPWPQGGGLNRLPVLFLTDLVVLPGMVVPVELDEAAQAAVDAARAGSDNQLLVAPRLEDRYASYGVVATVERVGKFAGGAPAAVLRAETRARIGNGVTGPGAALWVEVETVEETVSDHARELAEDYRRLVVAVLQRREAWQVIDSVNRLTDPSELADAAGYASYLTPEQKRELLETPDVEQRLETVIAWTRDHLAEAEIADKIGTEVREGMEKSQREFLLRQQLAAIRKELGEGEPEGADDYRVRVEAADVPDHVREALLREVDKLERSSDQSPETAWIRTWLDTVLDLPWAVRTDATTVEIDVPDLKELVGRPRFTPEAPERTSVPGVATGLAVTGMGGDVLFIEASAHESSSNGGSGLTLTGQLGDVMKESAQIALSFVRAHAAELGVDPAFFDQAIHVHVPAGATPKDGPSAGVAMVTALTSLATGRPVRSEVGMTGEVTLNGRVLPIGGLKQNLLAAQRNGLTEVFVPLRNEPDLDDVPAEVLETVTVHVVGDVLDVVRGALVAQTGEHTAAA